MLILDEKTHTHTEVFCEHSFPTFSHYFFLQNIFAGHMTAFSLKSQFVHVN